VSVIRKIDTATRSISFMHCKKAYLIVNPRAGQNIATIPGVIAVLSAAGWKTTIALKEFGGHAMKLATKAADRGYDLVIAYGGDGTLSQVINGVMNSKGQQSIVGVIPGGTANQWASEIGVPADPMKAALTLINSIVHKVDIGHLEVEGLTFPTTQDAQQPNGSKQQRNRKVKATSKAKHHFLLTTGLGFDAAVIRHVSKPLKYRLGRLAFGVAAAQNLPDQHPFPVEIGSNGNNKNSSVLWHGEAMEVVISNTRRYADAVDITPDAYIDDGILDVCVITAGTPLETVQQLTSLLVMHKPDNLTAEFFRGAHFSLGLPASIHIQLDGSTATLKDYLSKPDRDALQRAGDAEHVIVNYRFNAMRAALRMAFPRTYNQALFRESAKRKDGQPASQQQEHPDDKQPDTQSAQHLANEQIQPTPLESRDALLAGGHQVTIVGIAPNPNQQHAYIIAGYALKQETGENKPVAICVDDHTTLLKVTGSPVALPMLEELQEGDGIIVEGKKSKRGVIQARRVVIPDM
jgi:YegS/Rv2252/BmrU family lipid kinase